jgi:putative endonuclease
MKQSEKKGQKNVIGAYGEQIACNYLRKKGFLILETNYLKKWGEIDIISRETRNNKVTFHFVEVKTVSYETKAHLEGAISHGGWRPEENVTREKLQKMHRTIESWIMEGRHLNVDWQIDVIAVRVVPREKYASVKYISNVIF